eukprot:CAMPEP_0114566858 /NCGR_PEP_ID=MMETSP0114-20121206/15136_1 /TAXON_ID=31324 /ORGANISM="Goniomonas sp, Strain m" /LENGTH=209 /DNA_ID=CAMNT_0001753337 /DNA_START=94 /DNA_END=723 /DNA_ORIENTATION=-
MCSLPVNALPSQAEALGMKHTEDAGYQRRYRNCRRVHVNADELAASIFERVRDFMHAGNRPAVNGMQWVPVGLNEVFRVCSYDMGGHFAPHHDAGFIRSPQEQSLLTFMLYLNDVSSGGTTNFLKDGAGRVSHSPSGLEKLSADPKSIVARVTPRAGTALVFDSRCLHEGSELGSGRKYIMRSEVMFRLQPVATAESGASEKGAWFIPS